MSKKKHKSQFNAPPKTWEKYQQTLKLAVSDDTVPSSSIEEIVLESSPTDSLVREDAIPKKSPPKRRLLSEEFQKIIGLVGTILAIVLFFGTIIWFFWDMNSSVNSTKVGLVRVETKVGELDKDWRIENQDIKISLAKILERFERLFDNSQKTRNK